MSGSFNHRNDRTRFRLPPRESQMALGLIAGLLGLCAVQFGRFDLFQLLLLMAFFVVGFWAHRAWAIYMLFGTFIFLKFFLFAPFFQYGLRFLSTADVFVVGIFLLFAAACFRYLETGRYSRTFYLDEALGEKALSQSKHQFPSLLGGRWWAVPVAVFVASILLSVIPYDIQMFPRARIKPFASRLIFLTLCLFFAWLVCRAVVGAWVRWRMDPEQADIQCRSLIAKEFWNESYSFQKRREKLKSRK